MAALPDTQADWARHHIEATRWKEASTYRNTYPHEYNVRSWHQDPTDFDRFTNLTRIFGNIQNFHQTVNTYLTLNDCKYWPMGYTDQPLDICNRTHTPEELFGQQWSSRTTNDIEATQWDWASPTWHTERTPTPPETLARVNDLRIKNGPKVLDIGCGTGALIEELDIPTADYAGLDPSSGMLNHLLLRHPRHRVRPLTLLDYLDAPGPGAPFDVAVAIDVDLTDIERERVSEVAKVLAEA